MIHIISRRLSLMRLMSYQMPQQSSTFLNCLLILPRNGMRASALIPLFAQYRRRKELVICREVRLISSNIFVPGRAQDRAADVLR